MALCTYNAIRNRFGDEDETRVENLDQSFKNTESASGQREPLMAHSEVIETRLVLVSARKSRGADYWDKDDYDVRLGNASGRVVGRIFRQPRAPKEQPWFWTITAREQSPSVYTRGYAASREQAMRYFKARYIRPAN